MGDIEQQAGAAIRRVREQVGVTQVQLGEAVGIPQPVVSAIERGSYPIRLHLAAAIADALDVPLAVLVPPRHVADALAGIDLATQYVRDALTQQDQHPEGDQS